MDKPNVIYAAAYDPSLERGFLTCSTVQMKHDDVEYICKDALFELLKPEKDISFCDDYERGCIDGRNRLREELLDKLNVM